MGLKESGNVGGIVGGVLEAIGELIVAVADDQGDALSREGWS
jgi:hypothetical protein